MSLRSLTVVAVMLGLAGCALPAHLWAPRPGPPPPVPAEQPPVVFIHGAFGSRLVEAGSGREVWPGGFVKLLFGRYAELAVDIDAPTSAPGRLVASGLFERTGARDYYHAILQSFRRAGYREGRPGEPVADRVPRYYTLVYDWRHDNLRAVRALDALIAQIRRDHGRPDLRVDLVAHSNGGLVARWYARYGTADPDAGPLRPSHEGAGSLRRVVLIGTPNLGTLESLHALLRGEEIGLRRVPPEVLATFPGTYALLPPPGTDWLVDAAGRAVRRDAYDPALWRELHIGVFDPAIARRVVATHGGAAQGAAWLERLQRYVGIQLERAGRVARALADPAVDDGIEPIVFGGECVATPARAVLDEGGGHHVLRLEVREASGSPGRAGVAPTVFAPGDGTVTRESALGSAILKPRYSMFLCTQHNQLTADPHFLDNLLSALLLP